MNIEEVFSTVKSIIKDSICPIKKSQGVLAFSFIKLSIFAVIFFLTSFIMAKMVGGFGQLMSIFSQEDTDVLIGLLPSNAQVAILVAYIVVSLLSMLLEVAFAYTMHFFKKGQEFSLVSGFVRAKEKFFQIMLWTFILLALATIIDALSRINPVFSLFGTFLSFGFGLAVYFLSPVLALEEGASLNLEFKKSAEAVASTWKEIVLVFLTFTLMLLVIFGIAWIFVVLLSVGLSLLLKAMSVGYVGIVVGTLVAIAAVASFVVIDFASMSLRLSLYELARGREESIEKSENLN